MSSRPNIKHAVSKVNTVARTLVDKWAERTAGGKGDVPVLYSVYSNVMCATVM
jgi:hypothetical protein